MGEAVALRESDGTTMPGGERTVRRPTLVSWILLWILGVVVVAKVSPAHFEGKWVVLAPLALAIAVAIISQVWKLHPAYTLCAAIFFTIFSGGWAQMGLGGLPLNRLLVAVAVLQVLLRAPGTANLPPIRIRMVHLLMLITVLYAAISAGAVGTLTNSNSLLLITDVLGLFPFLLFLVAPSIFADERERDWLLVTLLILGAYLAITTVLESVGPHGLVFPSYIVSSDAARSGVPRPGGPFQSPVSDGFACFSCAVAAAIAFHRWKRRQTRVVVLAIGFACLVACFLTLERGVWVGAVVALAVVAVATSAGRRLLIPGAILGFVAIGAVLTVFPALSERTAERASHDQSVWERKEMTATGIRMVEARPLLGFGWDEYENESLEYFRQPDDVPMAGYTPVETIGLPMTLQPLHDTYLAYAVELGLVGCLLWLGSVLGATGGALLARGPRSLSQWKLGLLAILTFFLVVSFVDPHQLPFPMVLLMLWAGVAGGGGVRRAPSQPSMTNSHLSLPGPMATPVPS